MFQKVKTFMMASLLLPCCLCAAGAHAMTVYPLDDIFKDVHMIAMSDVEHELSKGFASQYDIDGKLKFAVLQFDKGIPLKTDAKQYDMQIAALNVNTRTNQFGATLSFTAPDNKQESVQLTGRYDEMVDVPVLTKRQRAKHLITADDVTMEGVEKRRIRSNTVMDKDNLIGKMLRRSVGSSHQIASRDVMRPLLVERNALVNIVYETPYMSLRASAVALEDGAKGDVIRVRNSSSSRIVQAVVENADTVKILQIGGAS